MKNRYIMLRKNSLRKLSATLHVREGSSVITLGRACPAAGKQRSEGLCGQGRV